MIDTGHETLAAQTVKLVNELPAGLIHELARKIEAGDVRDWPRLRLHVLELTPQPRFRALIEELIDVWRRRAPTTSPGGVALALRSAAAAAQHYRHEQSVELIWTGPDIPGLPLRRTDQALVQVIDAAQKSLLIVSFVVYRVPAITQALISAFERGVFLRICVEAPEPSGQRIAYDTIQALGQDVLDRAAIYIWPRDQRPTDPDGRFGSLHAKCAVADHELLFISSANLTGHAMHLNMELGVLIRGGRQPATVATHFERLSERGVLQQVNSSV